MTHDQLRELQKFNQNIEWLKQSNPNKEIDSDLVSMKEAMRILNRQRTWIQVRMHKTVDPGIDVNASLIRDADWLREGNRIMFKRESILRLKHQVLTAIGNKYDNV